MTLKTNDKASKRGSVIVLVILVLIGVTFSGIFIYWKVNKNQIITKAIDKAIVGKSAGLYTVHYDSLVVDEKLGYLNLSNIHIGYDSARLNVLSGEKKQPSKLFTIDIPSLQVFGVKTPRVLLGKEIAGQRVVIRSPIIHIYHTNATDDSSKNVPLTEQYRQILGDLNLISIDTIEISNATIVSRNLKSGGSKIDFRNASFLLTDFVIDSLSSENSSRILFSKSITFSCEKINWSNRNKLYEYELSGLSGNTTGKLFHIKRFDINPQMGEDAFVKSVPTQTDRIDVKIRDLVFRNLDFSKLMEEELFATDLNVGSASVMVYRDLNIPRDKKNRVGEYPHQQLMKVEMPFNIRKATWNSVFLEYKEKSNVSGMTGNVKFTNAYISMANLTNRKSAIAKDNTTEVNVQARLMDIFPLKAKFQFFLGSGKFAVNGSLGGANATDLNVVTRPMGMAELKSGRMNNLEFSFSGNDYNSNGKLTLLYNDLKIRLLEKDKGEEGLDKRRVMSIVANKFIDDDNPKKNEPVRIAEIQVTRNTNRSFYYLLWQSIFTGVQQTLGVKPGSF